MNENLRRVGFYSAILVSTLTILTFGIAIFTPPFSGPWCVENCFTYPFLDIAERFPRDYYWMYPAILLFLSYMVLMSTIHRYAPEDKKVYSQIGLSFAISAATIFVADFFVQLSVVQPSLINGEFDGISLLTQFNSHGVFITLEEVGYILMSLSFLFMAPVFTKWIRWIFVSAFVLTIAALIFVSAKYGLNREYIFEVAAISINWLALIISGVLLSLFFKGSKK